MATMYDGMDHVNRVFGEEGKKSQHAILEFSHPDDGKNISVLIHSPSVRTGSIDGIEESLLLISQESEVYMVSNHVSDGTKGSGLIEKMKPMSPTFERLSSLMGERHYLGDGSVHVEPITVDISDHLGVYSDFIDHEFEKNGLTYSEDDKEIMEKAMNISSKIFVASSRVFPKRRRLFTDLARSQSVLNGSDIDKETETDVPEELSEKSRVSIKKRASDTADSLTSLIHVLDLDSIGMVSNDSSSSASLATELEYRGYVMSTDIRTIDGPTYVRKDMRRLSTRPGGGKNPHDNSPVPFDVNLLLGV